MNPSMLYSEFNSIFGRGGSAKGQEGRDRKMGSTSHRESFAERRFSRA